MFFSNPTPLKLLALTCTIPKFIKEFNWPVHTVIFSLKRLLVYCNFLSRATLPPPFSVPSDALTYLPLIIGVLTHNHLFLLLFFAHLQRLIWLIRVVNAKGLLPS